MIQAKAGKPPVVLTIAGFDPSCGAGVTADLQVFAAHRLFGTAAITALTVQSTLGVAAVHPVDASVLRRTLEHLTADMVPAGVKIGMLGTAAAIHEIAAFLSELSDIAGEVPVVLDPVLRSSSDAQLLETDATKSLIVELLPLVSFVTPNSHEAQQLARVFGESTGDPIEALGKVSPRLNVVVTGGEDTEPVDLWRAPDGMRREFRGSRVVTTSTHGTGCAFSSALLCNLVLGSSASEAIARAKTYVEGALKKAPGLGGGAGPMDLLWPLRSC